MDLPANRYLDCGTKLDDCTALKDGQLPEAGSVSVCICCGGLAIFTADLSFRRPTPQEAFQLAASFEVQRAVQVVRQLAQQRGKRR